MDEQKLELANSGYPGELYSSIPCTIGYSYVRFEVDGRVRPCCVVRHFMGDTKTDDWRKIWHSQAYDVFRQKLRRIHLEKFHLVDPEWFPCQFCSHVHVNIKNSKRLNQVPIGKSEV